MELSYNLTFDQLIFFKTFKLIIHIIVHAQITIVPRMLMYKKH